MNNQPRKPAGEGGKEDSEGKRIDLRRKGLREAGDWCFEE